MSRAVSYAIAALLAVIAVALIWLVLRSESDRAALADAAERQRLADKVAADALAAEMIRAEAERKVAADAIDLEARMRRCREFPDGLQQLRALGLRGKDLPSPPPGCNPDGTGTADSFR
jgi:hypothetical protein